VEIVEQKKKRYAFSREKEITKKKAKNKNNQEIVKVSY